MDLSPSPVILWGENGAGKTNILEAVSLLSPGRGLRQRKLSEMLRQGAGVDSWQVHIRLRQKDQSLDFLTEGHIHAERERRSVNLFERPLKTQTQLADYASMIWMTPAMDRLFVEGASGRRKFFDRLVLALHPHHGAHSTQFEGLMKERLKILEDPFYDPRWLGGVEDQLSQIAYRITQSRHEVCQQLNEHMIQRQRTFPQARVSCEGESDGWFNHQTEESWRHRFKEKLASHRFPETRLPIGPSRTDFHVEELHSGRQAPLCSTGEQKALLISIILAFAELMTQYSIGVPLLLLDEAAAHLDPQRRRDFFDEVFSLGIQVWMTGTDRSFFEGCEGRAQFFQVKNGEIER